MSLRSIFGGASFVGSIAWIASACSSSGGGPLGFSGRPDGGHDARATLSFDTGTGPGPGTGPLTCEGILDCAQYCPDASVTECEAACLARGSAASQEAARNLAECFNGNGCMDEACLNMYCSSELVACKAN